MQVGPRSLRTGWPASLEHEPHYEAPTLAVTPPGEASRSLMRGFEENGPPTGLSKASSPASARPATPPSARRTAPTSTRRAAQLRHVLSASSPKCRLVKRNPPGWRTSRAENVEHLKALLSSLHQAKHHKGTLTGKAPDERSCFLEGAAAYPQQLPSSTPHLSTQSSACIAGATSLRTLLRPSSGVGASTAKAAIC